MLLKLIQRTTHVIGWLLIWLFFNHVALVRYCFPTLVYKRQINWSIPFIIQEGNIGRVWQRLRLCDSALFVPVPPCSEEPASCFSRRKQRQPEEPHIWCSGSSATVAGAGGARAPPKRPIIVVLSHYMTGKHNFWQLNAHCNLSSFLVYRNNMHCMREAKYHSRLFFPRESYCKIQVRKTLQEFHHSEN
jgi:hypothetical protein